jgi:N-acetyl-anhydromuramyl-L-alanine amidase AmpD
MAWYPAATRREIRPGANDPAIEVVGAILHVDAGDAGTLFDYFNGPSGGIESHFYVRRDGKVEQYRSTGVEADANLKANSFLDSAGVRRGYVSIETQGLEAGEWTPAQLAAIKALLLWLADKHGFPLRPVPKHTAAGVGYHTMFGAPGPWTPAAKTCPGPARIRQFKKDLVPWMAKQSKPAKPAKETPYQRLVRIAAQRYRRIKALQRKLKKARRK